MHEDAVSCLESPYNLTPLFASYPEPQKHKWVSYVRGTPKMSQSGLFIYGMNTNVILFLPSPTYYLSYMLVSKYAFLFHISLSQSCLLSFIPNHGKECPWSAMKPWKYLDLYHLSCNIIQCLQIFALCWNICFRN